MSGLGRWQRTASSLSLSSHLGCENSRLRKTGAEECFWKLVQQNFSTSLRFKMLIDSLLSKDPFITVSWVHHCETVKLSACKGNGMLKTGHFIQVLSGPKVFQLSISPTCGRIRNFHPLVSFHFPIFPPTPPVGKGRSRIWPPSRN